MALKVHVVGCKDDWLESSWSIVFICSLSVITANTTYYKAIKLQSHWPLCGVGMLPVANSVLCYNMHCTFDFRASGRRIILCYDVSNEQCTSAHTIQGSIHDVSQLLHPHLIYLDTNGKYSMHQKPLPVLSI